MSSLTELEQFIFRLLEQDRVWSAYALADLAPQHSAHSLWIANQAAVLLIYQGLNPPVLFSCGQRGDLAPLFLEIPKGAYVFTLRRTSRNLLDDRLAIEREERMWRMAIRPEEFNPSSAVGVVRLTSKDLGDIEDLFADHPDRPDAFTPSQVEEGIYFGIRDNGALLSVAGTHVLSTQFSVGAIGNVFTRPDHRNKGLGTKVSSSVVATLIDGGIRTIVLNVSQRNHPAISSYTRIGFQPYCSYQEGTGTLIN